MTLSIRTAGRIAKVALDIVSSVLMIAVCSYLLRSWLVKPGSREQTAQAATRRPAPQAKPQAPLPATPVTIGDAPVEGADTARVVLLEYADAQCPYCGRFARDTVPELKRKYFDTGKVLFAYRHLPLESIHPYSFHAAEAAECARRQGGFWQFQDAVFRNQQKIDDQSLRAIAALLKLEPNRFSACLQGETSKRVRDDAAEAKRLEVTGTPTFFVGSRLDDGRLQVSRRLSGALPLAQFETALDQALARVDAIQR